MLCSKHRHCRLIQTARVKNVCWAWQEGWVYRGLGRLKAGLKKLLKQSRTWDTQFASISGLGENAATDGSNKKQSLLDEGDESEASKAVFLVYKRSGEGFFSAKKKESEELNNKTRCRESEKRYHMQPKRRIQGLCQFDEEPVYTMASGYMKTDVEAVLVASGEDLVAEL